MMLNMTDDIRSVTDLKRKTREILDQIHRTGRPVVLTVNGRADAVLLDVKTYENNLKAAQLAPLLAEAEQDIAQGHTRSFSTFLKQFKNARKV